MRHSPSNGTLYLSRMIFRINSPTKYAVVQDFVTLSSNEYSVRVPHAVYSNSAYSKTSFFLLSIWNPTTCNCLFFFFQKIKSLLRFSLSFHLIIAKRYISVRSNEADATLTKSGREPMNVYSELQHGDSISVTHSTNCVCPSLL